MCISDSPFAWHSPLAPALQLPIAIRYLITYSPSRDFVRSSQANRSEKAIYTFNPFIIIDSNTKRCVMYWSSWIICTCLMHHGMPYAYESPTRDIDPGIPAQLIATCNHSDGFTVREDFATSWRDLGSSFVDIGAGCTCFYPQQCV
jgi:hypothetical protein